MSTATLPSRSVTGRTPRGRVLVVDDHPEVRAAIADILERAGHRVTCLGSAPEALELLAGETFDVILTDLKMPGMSGLEFLRELAQRPHGAQAVMLTAHASVASAVEAMRHGAFDYIEKPFDADQIEDLVARALVRGRLFDRSAPLTPPPGPGTPLVGSSRPMQRLREAIAQAAPTSETVLITGESGTGKELVAQAIHAQSRRADRPLVGLNCPVLSAQLMESELFGHERGAFTGAEAPRTGRFELADGGTLLLDEVSEIELPLQAKLLRVLQEHTFERVGSSQTVQVDVRVLATSNRELSQEASAGRFRQDLYFRLAVIPIHLPPLRERRDDLPLLIEHFRDAAAARLGRQPCEFGPSALDLLSNYHWPGNVRELQNLVKRAAVMGGGRCLDADDLAGWLIDAQGQSSEAPSAVTVGLSLDEMERHLIEATLEHFNGHRAQTAEALGIGIRTLTGKLREYGYAPRAKVPGRGN